MSLSGCARDLAMGAISTIAGWIVTQDPASGRLSHFNWLGWIALGAGIISVWLASRVRMNEGIPPREIPHADAAEVAAAEVY